MPLAVKNNAIILQDGKLAENCGCCGCPQNCECGCSCDSPLPPQVVIELSEIPSQLISQCRYDLFNRSYKLCASSSSVDKTPASCTQQSACSQMAGLCSRMQNYSWQGVDDAWFIRNIIGSAVYDSCAYASAAFGSPIAGASSQCLGEFVFSANSLGLNLTLKGLFTKTAGNVFTPAKLPGSCGTLGFDGYSQVWIGRSDSDQMYLYDSQGLRKSALADFQRFQPLPIYARIKISGSQQCESSLLTSGDPAFKTQDEFAVDGNGFNTTPFSQAVTATASVSFLDDGWVKSGLVGPNCSPCQSAQIIRGSALTTAWTISRRDRGDPIDCFRAFSSTSDLGRASIAFLNPGGCSNYPTTKWFWSIPARIPNITLVAGSCGQSDPAFPACPQSDLTADVLFGRFVVISALTNPGQLPPSFYLSRWGSRSCFGASSTTQSVDGQEAAPTFNCQDRTFTMSLVSRYRITIS